jgi:hypothetical protein
MKSTEHHDERIAKMTFASVYPLYLKKIERKGRSQDELNQVISWLTGYSWDTILVYIRKNVTFEAFFQNANLHPNAGLIKGNICGYKVEDIENKLTQKVRYLDKLVDELAQGKKIEKILRNT